MNRFWLQVGAVARKDLLIEGRVGEVLYVTIPFGAVALLLLPLAVGTDLALLENIGAGLYWSIVLLFGMMVAFRQTAEEGPAQRDMLAMMVVDPAARFTGKSIATAALLGLFEAALLPVVIVLYDPESVGGWGWLAAAAVLVAIGLAMVGTLAASVTAGLRTRNTLAPLLVAPLSLPLLVGATQVYESLTIGESPLIFLALLLAVDLALAIAGVITAPAIEEAS